MNWLWKFSLFPQSNKKFESWAKKTRKAKEANNKTAQISIWNCNWNEIIHDLFYRFLLESKLSFFILNYVFTNFSLQCDLISGFVRQKQSSALPWTSCSFQFLIWGYEKDFASFPTFYFSLFETYFFTAYRLRRRWKRKKKRIAKSEFDKVSVFPMNQLLAKLLFNLVLKEKCHGSILCLRQ